MAYIRSLNYIHVSLKTTTQLMKIPNYKNFEAIQTYEPQLWPSAAKFTLDVLQILAHVHVCYSKFVKDGYHSIERVIWSIDVYNYIDCMD